MTERDPDAPASSTQTLSFLTDPAKVIEQQSLSEAQAGSPMGNSTSLVEYHAAQHCLIIGDTDTAIDLSDQLPAMKVTILNIDEQASGIEKRLTDTGVHVYTGPVPDIQGYLGAFQVSLPGERAIDLGVLRITETGFFDQILDLSASPVLPVGLAPFGYFHAPEPAAVAAAVEQIPDLVGNFEKPRFFDYSEKICAHSRSQLEGCTNCIDICVAEAITSSDETIEVDPYLCQGCGACASVCPTGALTYAYPRPAEAIDRTRKLLDADSDATVLLIYAGDDDPEIDQRFEEQLPDWVIAVAVEEVPAYGIDYWATMLVAGFDRIVCAMESSSDTNPNLLGLRAQAATLAQILAPLGFEPAPVVVTETGRELSDAVLAKPVIDNQLIDSQQRRALARFSTHNEKRQTFRAAIDQLLQLSPSPQRMVELPEGSPFGRVSVDDKCTLCMACASVCPAGALLDGQGAPKLRFIESNCVQCGLCETACPEEAISLQPQYTYDSVEARAGQTLNEEEPFNCVRCHKPFATRKMIDTMNQKLASHWMFSDGKALRRLQMCEDCRVIDMFEEDAKGIDVHRDKPPQT